MGKKNWIEFDNQEKNSEEKAKVESFNKKSNINISKQKKGKKGKTITLITGLGTEDQILLKELLKKIKIFCGTGGTLIESNIQLQGDMVSKSIEFLRKEGFYNL
jgi:translation initiation factor 1